MIGIEGQPILTAAAMRAVEERAAPTPEAMYALMESAGAGVADAVARLAAGAEVLILCGPGNNGGDGYVAARVLREGGHRVRVAAAGEAGTPLSRQARAGWTGPVERIEDAAPAPVLVDALFGTGVTRRLPHEVDGILGRLLPAAHLSIAVDLPSGVNADTGAQLAAYPRGRHEFGLTLALGAVKPAHVLQPTASLCGEVRLIDIGLPAPRWDTPYHNLDPLWGNDHVIGAVELSPPGPGDQKYTRGMVAVVAGAMEGAARLAATAALRAGAGYAALYGGSGAGGPDALVHRPWDRDALRDPRVRVIVIGPGLGRDDDARVRLEQLIEDDAASLIIDGDALHLLDLPSLAGRGRPVVLTPHEGEFQALFGDVPGSTIERAHAAAERTGGNIVVLKGSTTVIADADHAIVSPGGSPWLSTAGTGDVLAGAIGAAVARTADRHPLEEAAAGVWVHAEAARRCGASFIADDLAHALTAARAACR